MSLVSLMSLSMSDASPFSLYGSCWSMTPSPAQLYRLKEGFPPAVPERHTEHKTQCLHDGGLLWTNCGFQVFFDSVYRYITVCYSQLLKDILLHYSKYF